MAEQTTTLHDFVVETKGNCFVCWNKMSLTRLEADNSLLSSVSSIHCLSRYLRIDMRKVFTGNEPIPPHLLERVQKSRLKVELCEGCAALSGNFSKLFRQLEKIEMEMASCLNLIQGKLEAEVRFDSRDKADKWKSQDEWNAKLEIAEALRKDAKHKCVRKLCSVSPLTKLERLTSKQVNEEKVKIKSANQNSVKHSKTIYDDNDIGSAVAEVISDDDGGDYPTCSPMSEENDGVAEPIIEMKQEMTPDKIIIDNEQIKGEEDAEHRPQTSSTGKPVFLQKLKTTKRRKVKNAEHAQLSQAIPPPIEVSGTGEDGEISMPKAIKNSESGKYKCEVCSKEYGQVAGFQYHYKSAHLKIKYRCTACGKDSTTNQSYEKHYLSIHMGVKFRCNTCDRTFTQQTQLKQHINLEHVQGRQLQCKYCDRIFSWPSNRNAHMKICPKRKKQ